MSYSYNITATFTATDIGKVVDCFGADYDMISQSTGLYDNQEVSDTISDIKKMAKRGFLKCVWIVLQDSDGKTLKAAGYDVSENASLWRNARPGDNLWASVKNGRLTVIVRYTDKWHQLTETEKRQFRESLSLTWGRSSIDVSFQGLSKKTDRHYASNGYGMQRTVYGY